MFYLGAEHYVEGNAKVEDKVVRAYKECELIKRTIITTNQIGRTDREAAGYGAAGVPDCGDWIISRLRDER